MTADSKTVELEALVRVLRQQLTQAIDAACNLQARVIVLEQQMAAEPRPAPELRAVE